MSVLHSPSTAITHANRNAGERGTEVFSKPEYLFFFGKTYYEVSVVPAFCVTSQLVPPDLCPEIPAGILPSSQTAHHWRLQLHRQFFSQNKQTKL
jgi:hypothetical protein